MTIAVVTGPAGRLRAVADALRSQGLSAVVLGGPERAEEPIAPGAAPYSAPPAASLADIRPGLSFCDWRTDVLSLIGVTDATYLGWPTAEGRWCTALLRSAVLSPLPRPDGPSGPSPSASAAEPRARSFAYAVLNDVGGPEAVCTLCGGAGCGPCDRTGLAAWIRPLADDFVVEMLPAFPADCIELPAADVGAWLERRTAGLNASRASETAPERRASPR